MLKQAGNQELKNTTHNTRKGWAVHLNEFFPTIFLEQLFYLVQMSSGF